MIAISGRLGCRHSGPERAGARTSVQEDLYPERPGFSTRPRRGALFTRSYAITHPSEPNYLALFSGSTQGIADDGCPYRFSAPNLAADLIRAGKTFAGYA